MSISRKLERLSAASAAAGRDEEAAAALAKALERYERKHNLPMARQVRERLADLQVADGDVPIL